MNREEFYKAVNGDKMKLSFSSLKQFQNSPYDFFKYKTKEFKSTEVMRFSAMAHTVLLEGMDKFNEDYIYQPLDVPFPRSRQEKEFCNLLLGEEEISIEDAYSRCYSVDGLSDKRLITEAKARRSKSKKYLEFMEKVNGRKVVLQKDWDLCCRLYDRLSKSGRAWELLSEGDSEVYFDDLKIEGLRLCGKIDKKMKGRRVDLKIYASANPRAFQRKIFQDLLHVQAAIYCEHDCRRFEDGVIDYDDYYLVVIDRTMNFSIHKLTAEVMVMGRNKLVEILKWYKHCRFNNSWEESYGFYSEGRGEEYDVYPPWWYEG